jgi:hypothetical protein
MGMLPNHKHELFAQGYAQGMTAGEAYVHAGYKPSPSSPTRMLDDSRIKERIQELIGRKAVNVVITKQYLMEAAVENLEKAIGRRPVKMGKDGNEVFVYRGDVANKAMQMLGSELNMFREQKEVTHKNGDLDQMTDIELITTLVEEAKVMLEDHSAGKSEDDENT